MKIKNFLRKIGFLRTWSIEAKVKFIKVFEICHENTIPMFFIAENHDFEA